MKLSVVLIALLLPLSALGKCPTSEYVATGRAVLDGGKPAVGATVGIAWVEGTEPAGPAIGTTDSKGSYRIRVPYQTYSGEGAQGDKCAGKLSKVSIVVQTRHLQSFGTVQTVRPERTGVIRLGTVPVIFKRASL